ncbi:MAG: copper-binding protein [Phycisphaeraceae bacterium]|nr:copper-binding protein [Phycisphaeraceae bacterium]
MKHIALVAASSLLLASCGEETKPDKKPAPTPIAETPPPQPVAQPTPEPEPKVETPASEVKAPATPANPTYTVRAEIETLPGIESSVMRLHHERIPTFANKDGKVGTDSRGKPGMKPMTMSFAKGAGVSYEGLKVGDKVEVIVEVEWTAALPEDRLVITKLTRLAPETKLDFEGQPSISDPKPEKKPEPK